ncbi:MAG: arginine--tRNA ligase [Candidatus Omnitrophota bacterium]|nr:arginine--tRNA ligase [Candidatus Omnitrophota bacterium]MBU1928863.1 arginine--tRNA ligase [Candidatus Omnitrophota bacterium]
MKEDLQDLLISLIQNSLKELKLDDNFKDDLSYGFSISTGFGDLSHNLALKLGSLLKKPPLEIAGSVVESLKKNLINNLLEASLKDIRVEGAGFINFYLKDSYFHGQLKGIITEGIDFFRKDLGKNEKIIIEFVSANPTGPLSVAHARQAAVGDSLANCLEFLGFKVQREFYLNDEGNQINILGRSVGLRLKELSGEKIDFPEDHYQGDYIYDIAKIIIEQGLKLNDYSEFSADYILDIIRKELDDFGVKFDCWYSQKELGKSGKIELALEELKKKKYVYVQDGAWWFKSTEFGDDKDRVVIKSDGSYTYLAPDIAYHQDKYDRKFKHLINLWGPDHHGYINRLKASVRAFGHDPETISIIIVQLATIFRDSKPLQMSTRKGQYITLREVLEEVGRDAGRFFFLMRRTSSHLDFDLGVAKKQTSENPVFYVQYAYARISSILKNSAFDINKQEIDLSLLKEKEELELIRKLWYFFYILNVCYKTYDPYMLTVYLQELAEAFHRFYDLHRVLGVEEKLSQSRLALIYGARTVLSLGLDLMGISKPDKM